MGADRAEAGGAVTMTVAATAGAAEEVPHRARKILTLNPGVLPRGALDMADMKVAERTT